MKFALAAVVSYWWPVVVRLPDPENPGAIVEQNLKVLFQPDDQDVAVREAEAYASAASVKDIAERERQQLERIVKDWDDVVTGPEKKPVPFTPENFRAALQQKWFRDGVFRAYRESLNGEARLGN